MKSAHVESFGSYIWIWGRKAAGDKNELSDGNGLFHYAKKRLLGPAVNNVKR